MQGPDSQIRNHPAGECGSETDICVIQKYLHDCGGSVYDFGGNISAVPIKPHLWVHRNLLVRGDVPATEGAGREDDALQLDQAATDRREE